MDNIKIKKIIEKIQSERVNLSSDVMMQREKNFTLGTFENNKNFLETTALNIDITDFENCISLEGFVIYPNSDEAVPSGNLIIGDAYGSYFLFVFGVINFSAMAEKIGIELNKLSECTIILSGDKTTPYCKVYNIEDSSYKEYTKRENQYVISLSWLKINGVFPEKAEIAIVTDDKYNETLHLEKLSVQYTYRKLTHIEVTTPPNKIIYVEGERFDKTGMVITAYYDNNTDSIVTEYTYTPTEVLTTDDTQILIFYTEEGVTKKTTSPIIVNIKSLSKIEVITLPVKIEYLEGEFFSPVGMKVRAYYNNGTFADITDYMYAPTGKLSPSITEISVSYTENGIIKTTTIPITVKEKSLTGITILTSPYKCIYNVGEKFDPAGMVVRAEFNNGTSDETVEYKYSPDGNLIAETDSVFISYTYKGVTKTAVQSIWVKSSDKNPIASSPDVRNAYEYLNFKSNYGDEIWVFNQDDCVEGTINTEKLLADLGIDKEEIIEADIRLLPHYLYTNMQMIGLKINGIDMGGFPLQEDNINGGSVYIVPLKEIIQANGTGQFATITFYNIENSGKNTVISIADSFIHTSFEEASGNPQNVDSMMDKSKSVSDYGDNPKINLVTGRVLLGLPGISVGENSYELGFSHIYNSGLLQRYSALETNVGNGWKLSVQQYIFSENEEYKYIDGAGYMHTFKKFDTRTNKYNDQSELGLTLSVSDKEYVVNDNSGNRLIFDGQGHLIKTISAQNDKIVKNYIYVENRLVSMYDSRRSKLKLNFFYENNLLIKAVVTDDNEELSALHYYYSEGNLVKITKTFGRMQEKNISIFQYISSGYLSECLDFEKKAAIGIVYYKNGRVKFINRGIAEFSNEKIVNFDIKTFEKFIYKNSDGYRHLTEIWNEKEVILGYYLNQEGKITSVFESKTDEKGRIFLKSLNNIPGVRASTIGNNGTINGSAIINPKTSSFGIIDALRKGEEDIIHYNVNMWIKHKTISDGMIIKLTYITNESDRMYYVDLDPDAYDAWQYVSIPITHRASKSKVMSNIKLEAYDIEGKLIDILVGDLSVVPCTKSQAFVDNENPSNFSLGTDYKNYTQIVFRTIDAPYEDKIMNFKKQITIDGNSLYIQDKNSKLSMQDILNTAKRNKMLGNDFLYEFVMNGGNTILPYIGSATLREPTNLNNVNLNLGGGEIKPCFRTRTLDSNSDTAIRYYVENDGVKTITTTYYKGGGINPGTSPEKTSTSEIKTDFTGKPLYKKDAYGVKTEYIYDEYGQPIEIKVTHEDTDEYILQTASYDSPNQEYLISENNGVTTTNYTYEKPFALPKSTVIGNGKSEIIYDEYKDKVTFLKFYDDNVECFSHAFTYENGNIRTISDGSVTYGIRYNLAENTVIFSVFDNGTETDIHKKKQVFEKNSGNTIFVDEYIKGTGKVDKIESVADKYGKLISLSSGTNETTTYRYLSMPVSRAAFPLQSLYDPYESREYICSFDNDGKLSKISTSDGDFIIQQIGATETKYVLGEKKYKTKTEYDSDCLIDPRCKKSYIYKDLNSDNDDDWVEVIGGCCEYEYDKLGRITTKMVSMATETAIYKYTYKSFDDSRTLPLIAKIEYNCPTYQDNWNSWNSFVSEYTYDNRGNIIVVQEAKDASSPEDSRYNRKTEYTYDNLNRLIHETSTGIAPTDRSYIYVETGNGKGRLNKITNNEPSKSKEFSYNERGEILTCMIGKGTTLERNIIYTHDNYGNISRKYIEGFEDYNFEWERGNLLKRITQKGNISAEYSYNHNNVRFKKISNGIETRYYLDGDKILGEDRSNGKKLRYYYDKDGLCGFELGEIDYTYIRDGQGNVLMVADYNGNVVASYRYDTEGKSQVFDRKGNEDTNPESVGNINPFRWKGYYYDTESGMYYAESRYYDPEILRYIDAAEADVILSNATNAFCLDRNGIMCASVIALFPYSATIETSGDLKVDPNYDPNEGKPWWELYFLQALLQATEIAIGILMIAGGQVGGAWLVFSGTVGMIGLALSEKIAKSIGLTIIGAEGLLSGVALLEKCCNPITMLLGITGIIAGGNCLIFASAEAQEGLGYGNWIKDIGISDGWYTGLMFASELAATAVVIYNQYGPKCFAAGTLVLCRDESGKECYKRIEEIEVGDRVLAYDEETGEQAYKPVVQLFKNETLKWCTVCVEVDGQEEEIISTPGHKYYLPNNTEPREVGVKQEHESYTGLSEKWVSASKLKAGDKVLLSNGEYGIIQSVKVEELSSPETTYNLEVEDFHTYYVGEKPVCVHNVGCKIETGDTKDYSIHESKRAAYRAAKRDAGVLSQQPTKVGPAINRQGHRIPGKTYTFGDKEILWHPTGHPEYGMTRHFNYGGHHYFY